MLGRRSFVIVTRTLGSPSQLPRYVTSPHSSKTDSEQGRLMRRNKGNRLQLVSFARYRSPSTRSRPLPRSFTRNRPAARRIRRRAIRIDQDPISRSEDLRQNWRGRWTNVEDYRCGCYGGGRQRKGDGIGAESDRREQRSSWETMARLMWCE